MGPFDWLEERACNTYSQHGEDGILRALFDKLPPVHRHVVEIGAADGTFCSNSRALIEAGWSATLIEADDEAFARLQALHAGNERVVCLHRRAQVGEGPDTLDALLDEAGAPTDPDLLVIDVDGPDYYLWSGLLRHKPRVVLVEGQTTPGTDPERIPAPAEARVGDQAGLGALIHLAWAKGYVPAMQIGCNLLAIRRELADLVAQPVHEPAAEVAEGPLRLNLGSGAVPLPGYRNLDIARGETAYPLVGIADGSVEEVRASHVLEHFSHREAGTVVHEWVRVLRPGGLLRIAVPDFRVVAERYLRREPGNPQGHVMGGHVDEHDRHGAIYDRDTLASLMQAHGVINIRKWRSEVTDCASLDVSLNLQGRKLLPVERGTVHAVMSVPRLGFTTNFSTLNQALRPHGIPVEMASGAFWGKVLGGAMQRHLDARYLLTVDYDTVFDWEDVAEMYRLMETRPEIDALFAVQMKREGHGPMFTTQGADASGRKTFGPELMLQDTLECETGHFGLTMLRTAALRHLPRPWFGGMAPPAGEDGWDDGTVDDDIAFWRRWRAAGYSLHMASRVVLGHLELMVTWPGREMDPLYQPVGRYHAGGPPEGVWR